MNVSRRQRRPLLRGPVPRFKGIVIGFWIVTALFCLQKGLVLLLAPPGGDAGERLTAP